MLAGLGDGATIVQDEKTLTITRTTQAGELKSVYNLDGSDSRNTLTLGGRMGGGGGGGGGAAGGGIETVSKARWDANKLVIATTLTFGQNSFETTMSLSLDDKGNLVIESTNPGRGGAVPTTTKTSYRKS
jgi:hypothetical protein